MDNASSLSMFADVLTPFALCKHTIPGILTKPKKGRLGQAVPQEYKAVLCNLCAYFSGNENRAYASMFQIHLSLAISCGRCFNYMTFLHSEMRTHLRQWKGWVEAEKPVENEYKFDIGLS